MAYTSEFTKFAQQVYLTVKGRYFDDIEEADGQDYLEQVLDWVNGFLDELETLTDTSGQPVYWNFARDMNFNIGNALTGDSIVPVPAEVLNIVATSLRPIKIVKDGQTVSTWSVVSPNQLNADSYDNRVAKAGNNFYFSRAFTDSENDGSITGDVIAKITRATEEDDTFLTTVVPRQLLVLGTAKNMVLPDIVQGGLTPSFVQKYNDLLQATILVNNATADSDFQDREDNSYIGGIGFN